MGAVACCRDFCFEVPGAGSGETCYRGEFGAELSLGWLQCR